MQIFKYFTEDEALFIRDVDRRVRNLYHSKGSFTPAISDFQISFVNKYFNMYVINHIKDAEKIINEKEIEYSKFTYSDNIKDSVISNVRHSLMNKYLNNINFENGLLESSYKVIMNVLNIREKFEEHTFNIIAFKFKFNKEGLKKIDNLEDAREMLLELCKILHKEYRISYYDEFMLAELIEFNESATNTTIMPDAFREKFLKTKMKYNIPDLKHNYIDLYRDLKDYFIGITPFTLYSIIENQKLMDYQRSPIINYTDNYGQLSTNNKSDIMCFGDCFGIKPKQLSKIFGLELKDCRNPNKRSKFFYALKNINSNLYS